ncbi:hypothetical protein [Streptomyces sp. NBC_00338]|uniref:hypothetical protein n=1 Tax=Streptomyces sp. NBC_00338 TaxID=2975715 RepID=UPI002250F334|nr:hypothetical protein [Streptomyces sp. NBC_00338]MCX5144679.1 hypothetical protein [Streptomyces sp. NBC_00338]
MTGGPPRAAHGRLPRAAEAVRGLGVGVVLLAFWGTAAVLSRGRERLRTQGGESVRRKA